MKGTEGHRLSEQVAAARTDGGEPVLGAFSPAGGLGLQQICAKKEREESIEEMHHADKLIERIVFLEGHPNLQTLDPLLIGQNIKEVLECDLKAEYSARELYREARACCRQEEDYVSMLLFEQLLKDEEGHIDFIETELKLYE